jgi:hypothetical protein
MYDRIVGESPPNEVPAMKNDDQNDELRDCLPLPPEITRQYPGQYIIYSEAEKRVIGAGKTEAEAFDQAEASGVKGLWHYAYAFAPDELIL